MESKGENDVSVIETELPGYTDQEADDLARSIVDHADASDEQTQKNALNAFAVWLVADPQRAKRLLFVRRLWRGRFGLAGERVIGQDE
jgi:hypothetical protein